MNYSYYNQPSTLHNIFSTVQTSAYEVARANILTNDKGMTIEIEVPGFSRSDISVETKGSTLTVSAKRSDDQTDKYKVQEFNTRYLARSWTLPKNINADKIVAAYDAGILTLTLPYRTDSIQETRRIEIG
jgi:HSP20 family protein